MDRERRREREGEREGGSDRGGREGGERERVLLRLLNLCIPHLVFFTP